MLSRKVTFNPKELAVCGFLLLIVALVFGQTIRHEFFNFDDYSYVCENPHVMGGVTGPNVVYAFTHGRQQMWVPLTWISLMLDAELYEFHAGGYHLTNVLLHAAAAMLLFLFLLRATDRFWPSVFAAALFAIHPLRVESVAWVTERKDVLSGVFFMLTLLAYVGYARRQFSFWRYALVALLFVLGLLAKPMLVTLPFVLLLLDYWPLGRMDLAGQEPSPQDSLPQGTPPQSPAIGRGASLKRFLWLLAEKVPLLIIAAAGCVITVLVQNTTLSINERLPLAWRIGNALISYLTYLENFFCPVGLAVMYPRLDAALPIGRLVAAVLVLVTITAAAILARRKCPYLLVGWLWYLGMSVPIIGFVQVGLTSVADRFTYLPQVGIAIALAWGAADVCRTWPYRRWICGIASTLVLTLLMAQAAYQTSFWRDSETLWNYTLRCVPDSGAAHNNLGDILAKEGRFDEAMAHFQKALTLIPDSAQPHYNLGHLLEIEGRPHEAEKEYLRALDLAPSYPLACDRMGIILTKRGQYPDAIAFFRRSLILNGDNVETRYDLAKAFAAIGRSEQADELRRQAAQTAPDFAVNQNALGLIVAGRGRTFEAIEHFQWAIEAKPDYVEARMNLARLRMKEERFSDAAEQFKAVLKIDPKSAEALDGMAQIRSIRGDSMELDRSGTSGKMDHGGKKSP
jgi:tetratricopeptide (TPR) repeat protein